jgi:hypothetical protein
LNLCLMRERLIHRGLLGEATYGYILCEATKSIGKNLDEAMRTIADRLTSRADASPCSMMASDSVSYHGDQWWRSIWGESYAASRWE